MTMADIIISALPLLFAAFVIFRHRPSLEKINAKRAFKGMSALTEDAFQRKVKRERTLCMIILAAAFVIANGGRAFVNYMAG